MSSVLQAEAWSACGEREEAGEALSQAPPPGLSLSLLGAPLLPELPAGDSWRGQLSRAGRLQGLLVPSPHLGLQQVHTACDAVQDHAPVVGVLLALQGVEESPKLP